MTIKNCLNFLRLYKEKADDITSSSAVRNQSLKNYENMKSHIINGRKFQGLPIVEELKNPKVEKEETKSKGKK